MTASDGFKIFRVYATEQHVVRTVADDLFEGNESQAIRHMIRDYAKRHLAEPAAGDGRGVLVDTRQEYTAK